MHIAPCLLGFILAFLILLAAYSSPSVTLVLLLMCSRDTLSVTQLCRGYFKHVFGALATIIFPFHAKNIKFLNYIILI